MNGNGTAAPMDFTASADDQPINLCDKLTPAHVTPSYQSDSCSTDGLRSRVKYAVKTTAEVRGWAARSRSTGHGTRGVSARGARGLGCEGEAGTQGRGTATSGQGKGF